MKSIARPAAAGLSALFLFAALASAPAQKPAKAAAVPYAKVDAILKAKCVGCHQGAKPAAGIALNGYDAVAKAKFKGKPVVVAKKPALSALSNAVHGKGMMKMPPGGSLTPDEMKAIDAWIAAGAKK